MLLDWRLGERYFAEKLLDFELASNVGGWQWASGSGCDAAPYFRVFNPESQLKKFDPAGAYVRKWVPEWGTPAYPAPIVEHKMARQRAIDTYKAALAREGGFVCVNGPLTCHFVFHNGRGVGRRTPLGHPFSDIGACGVKFLELTFGVEDPEVRRGITSASRRPLPSPHIGGKFKVEQLLGEIAFSQTPV